MQQAGDVRQGVVFEWATDGWLVYSSSAHHGNRRSETEVWVADVIYIYIFCPSSAQHLIFLTSSETMSSFIRLYEKLKTLDSTETHAFPVVTVTVTK